MASMDVEVLVVGDPPNEGRAVTLVRRALDDVGLKRVPIRTQVVTGEQDADGLDADGLGFFGSPTIHINGSDPFEAEEWPRCLPTACTSSKASDLGSRI
jgi:hypothetical protein